MTLDHVRRLEDRVATLAGIATGIFGVVATCGLVILPSETTTQKVLVVTACLALSIACVAGIGAWRSARRFTLTVSAAMLSILLLSTLAVITANLPSSPGGLVSAPNPSASSTSPSLPPYPQDVGTSVGPTLSDTTESGVTSSPLVYLADLTAIGNDGFSPGPATVNGKSYERSLVARIGCAYNPASVEYNVNREYVRFQADIGVSDDAAAGGSVPFRLLADGKVILETTLTLGQSMQVDKPITGVFRLSIEYPDDGCPENRGSIVWGNARLQRKPGG